MEEKVTLRELQEAGFGLEDFYKIGTSDLKEREGIMETYSEHQRELLENSNANATYFVREIIFDKVMEGAEKIRCMRDVLKGTTFGLKGSGKDYRFVLHENRNGTLLEVPPTSEYPVPRNESYREILFKSTKYGEICQIEDELIDDAMFDIIEMRMTDLGERAENTINQRAIDVVIGCSNASNVSYSHGEPFWSIAEGVKQVKVNGFQPDTLVMTAEMEGDIYLDPHWRYDYSGETGNFRTQEIGRRILGLTPWVLTIDSANGSYGGAVKGVVMQANKAAGLMFKDDISLEKFNDPKNDLTNVKIRTRFDAKCFYGKSISLLST